MNRDKIRERIRNGSIRDPVIAADGPPIYHATRSNGKPLRVAYYRHVKSDHLDTSIYAFQFAEGKNILSLPFLLALQA